MRFAVGAGVPAHFDGAGAVFAGAPQRDIAGRTNEEVLFDAATTRRAGARVELCIQQAQRKFAFLQVS
jgi:hypothetical protein